MKFYRWCFRHFVIRLLSLNMYILICDTKNIFFSEAFLTLPMIENKHFRVTTLSARINIHSWVKFPNLDVFSNYIFH